MRKIRFLCDVDGIVADFTGLYMAATKQALGYEFKREELRNWDVGDAMHLTKEEKNKVHALLDAPGMGKNIHPYPGAVAAIKRIVGMVDEFYFVTSPLDSNPTWVPDRNEWVEKHFGKDLKKKIIYTHDKYPIYGNFLLDDKPQHVEEWRAAWPQGVAMLWNQPYNEGDAPNAGDASKGVRVYTWTQVELLVKSMRNYSSKLTEETA